MLGPLETPDLGRSADDPMMIKALRNGGPHPDFRAQGWDDSSAQSCPHQEPAGPEGSTGLHPTRDAPSPGPASASSCPTTATPGGLKVVFPLELGRASWSQSDLSLLFQPSGCIFSSNPPPSIDTGSQCWGRGGPGAPSLPTLLFRHSLPAQALCHAVSAGQRGSGPALFLVRARRRGDPLLGAETHR